MKDKTPQEVADEVVSAWAEQLRADGVLMQAIGRGRKVDVTLFAHRGQVQRNPEVTLRAS